MEELRQVLGPVMVQGAKRTSRRKPKCPICARPVEHEFRPFCSKRCADEDLSRWLGGAYRIPVEEAATPQDDGAGEGSPVEGYGVFEDEG